MNQLNKYINHKNILILDDSIQWSQDIKNWLEDKFSLTLIKTFNDVDNCLYEIDNNVNFYDCIIIDYYLNDGHIAPDVIKHIRRLNSNILIVVVSYNFKTVNELSVYETRCALMAGANRISNKTEESLEMILSTHFCVRANNKSELQLA